jgi:hypothetical protein
VPLDVDRHLPRLLELLVKLSPFFIGGLLKEPSAATMEWPTGDN